MSNGRRAALPPTAYRLPVRCDDRGDYPLRLSVFPEHGRYAVEFDFAALPVSDAMRRWLLERFAVATGPSGTYRTERSARSLMSAVRSFAAYLGSLIIRRMAPAVCGVFIGMAGYSRRRSDRESHSWGR